MMTMRFVGFVAIVGLGSMLAACPGGGDGIDTPNDAGTNETSAPDAPAGPAWSTVLENLDGSLLAIWGSSSQDIWAVGGPLGNEGFESLVMHWDGAAWTRRNPGKIETFWWVHGTSANDVWLAGEKGRITHWDGAAFTEMTSGTDATLFGIHAFAANDVWAVGGTPESTTATNDVVLHYDGTSWKPEAVPTPTKSAFFKVWGSSSNDLYVVGDLGVIWHRAAGVWTREAEGIATGRLTTVTGCSATEIYAVGGRDVLQSNGSGTWTRASIDPLKMLNDVNGVSCAAPGRVVIVGGGSLKFRLVNGEWESDFGSVPFPDLHGAWADPSTGAFWGVGGQFLAAPRAGATRNGVIGVYR